MIIAIDGPSGSGKSTLGRMLARALNLLYIDTGSMYRAVALATIEAKLDPKDKEAVTALANRVEIDLRGDPDSLSVLLDGRDITDQIRTESVTDMSSIVSTIPGVRRAPGRATWPTLVAPRCAKQCSHPAGRPARPRRRKAIARS